MIQDEGCGIAQAELPRIFDRFHTTRTARQGTGLGLAIVREIARRHDVDVQVESVVDKGTKFTFPFPGG